MAKYLRRWKRHQRNRAEWREPLRWGGRRHGPPLTDAHSKVKAKVAQSCLTLWPHGLCSPWNSPGQITGVGSLSLLQRIFPTQGLNTGLLHHRQILYQLSHRGSPRILEWIAYPFSSGSSWPRNQTTVSCITGGFFTNWAIRDAHYSKENRYSLWTENFQMFKLDLEKAEEPEIKLPTSIGSLKKQESFRKTSITALLTMAKPLTVWITTNCGEFFKRW